MYRVYYSIFVVVTLAVVTNAFTPMTRSMSSRFSPSSSFSALDANVYDSLVKEGNYGKLLEAIDAAGFGDVLRNTNPITIFAPNGEFNKDND